MNNFLPKNMILRLNRQISRKTQFTKSDTETKRKSVKFYYLTMKFTLHFRNLSES